MLDSALVGASQRRVPWCLQDPILLSRQLLWARAMCRIPPSYFAYLLQPVFPCPQNVFALLPDAELSDSLSNSIFSNTLQQPREMPTILGELHTLIPTLFSSREISWTFAWGRSAKLRFPLRRNSLAILNPFQWTEAWLMRSYTIMNLWVFQKPDDSLLASSRRRLRCHLHVPCAPEM